MLKNTNLDHDQNCGRILLRLDRKQSTAGDGLRHREKLDRFLILTWHL